MSRSARCIRRLCQDATFPWQVGVYVLLGSAEHSLLDSKGFYRPVVTPYELHLALTPGAEWSGEHVGGRFLTRLPTDPSGLSWLGEVGSAVTDLDHLLRM